MSNMFKNIQNTIKKAAESKRLSLVFCLIAGILGVLPYYFEPLFIFTFISLIIIFYFALAQKRVHKRYFLPFFAYFLGFYTPLYLFLMELYPYDRFGFTEGQSVFIVICSCVLIPLIHALMVTAVMLLAKFFRGNKWDIVVYAALWCISEWVLTLGVLAFPWGNIAISLTGFLPYLQTASLFGKYFITFITVLGCCAIAYGIRNAKKVIAFIGAGVILINAIAGSIMWFIPQTYENSAPTAIVQGNALSDEKWQAGSNREIFERTLSLTRDAAKSGSKLIILAESAIPTTFRRGGYVHVAFAEIAIEYQTTIIMGAHYIEDSNEYNSAIAILPDGTLSERYDKRHLVPFGEFIPYADTLGTLIPFVAAFNESSSVFTEGSEAKLIDTENGKIVPLVCFDSIFPEFAREGCQKNGELLAIVTNDSWFYDSVGVYTHLRHSQLRSIECGKNTVRAANTGVSAFIDSKGEIIANTDPLTEDILYGNAYLSKNRTLYSFIGDIPLYISFVIAGIFILNKTRRTKNGKNSAPSK